MKETISYYYNLDVYGVEEKNSKYHFNVENKDYFFVPFYGNESDINDVLEIYNLLTSNGMVPHKICININNSFLTKVDECNYVLLETDKTNEKFDIISIKDFAKNNVIITDQSHLIRSNWIDLWSKKIDYFEYQIKELALDKEIVKNSCGYYIGLAENAISYVDNTIKLYERFQSSLVLSHRRIYYPNYKINFLNPLTLIYDYKVRDPAEYLKSLFFESSIDDAVFELKIYLSSEKMNIFDYHMLYARLLYPSYYFDVYDNVMNKGKKEDDLVKIISKSQEYELFLKKAYLEISKYAKIDRVDWLIY